MTRLERILFKTFGAIFTVATIGFLIDAFYLFNQTEDEAGLMALSVCVVFFVLAIICSVFLSADRR